MQIPGFVLIVNTDLTDQVKGVIIRQLMINEEISFDEYIARLAIDPEYHNIVRNSGRRILIMKEFWDRTGFDLADIVIFVYSGMCSIEKNNMGPLGFTVSLERVTMYDLLWGADKFTINNRAK